MAFLAMRYGISPGGISSAQTVLLLAILVSSAGPEANERVSKPSLSQLPSLEEFRAGKGKASGGWFKRTKLDLKGHS